MRLFLYLRLGELKGQLFPHIASLEVITAKEQLAGVEGTVCRVAYLPVGLNDGLSGRETILHIAGYVPEDLFKKSLIFFFKGQPVSVFLEAIYEVLGQVRSSDYTQLAKEVQPSVVQPDHSPRPNPRCCPAGGIGFPTLLRDQSRFLQYLVLLSLGHILEDGHVAGQPIVGRVKHLTIRALSPLGQGDQLVQSL